MPIWLMPFQTACWGWTVLGSAISSLVNLEKKLSNLELIFAKVGWVVDIPARTDLHCRQHLLFPQHIQVHKFYTPIVVNFTQLITGFCWQSWGPLTQMNQQISGHHLHFLQSYSWNIAKLSQKPKLLQNQWVSMIYRAMNNSAWR